MQDPQNLLVWQRSMDVAVLVHSITRKIPPRSLPGLGSQLIRSVASIPANIAEGVGQPYPGVTVRHLTVAIGSAYECETHLRLAARLVGPELGVDTALDEIGQIRRMLYGLRTHFEKLKGPVRG